MLRQAHGCNGRAGRTVSSEAEEQRMTSEKSIHSRKGGKDPLARAEATVAVLGRMWLACPPPLKTVVWTMTLVVVAALLQGAELVGIDPFSGASDLLMDAIEQTRGS